MANMENLTAQDLNMKQDVVVLGMPSSGKTVFLSVLGRQFMIVPGGNKAAPLGFCMVPDPETLDTVTANNQDLDNGIWPKSTIEGRVAPLKWDVMTGNRLLFQLTSMDISGETFRKAFGLDKDGPTSKRRTSKGADALLGGPESVQTTTEVAEALREAVDAAKVVCFFVNIALPEAGPQLENFGSVAKGICKLLQSNREIAGKSLVVLTQAHLHNGEIDRAGGPIAYLGGIGRLGGVPAALSQQLAMNHVPVITVSAVNETDADNKVPAVIESEGLFGFLLTVSGMLADNGLASVREAYLDYLAARTQYRQRPCRPVDDRMSLAAKYQEAGLAFHAACIRYLNDESNFHVTPADLSFFRDCTERDADVSASQVEWKFPLDRECAWDRALRDCAWEGRLPTADLASELFGRIERRLRDAGTSATGVLSEHAIFGFTHDELVASREALDGADWIARNLTRYAGALSRELDAAGDVVARFATAVSRLAEVPADDVDFDRLLAEAVRLELEAERTLAGLAKGWGAGTPEGMRTDQPRFAEQNTSFRNAAARLKQLVATHEDALERQQIERERQTRIRKGLLVGLGVTFLCVVLTYAHGGRFILFGTMSVGVGALAFACLQTCRDRRRRQSAHGGASTGSAAPGMRLANSRSAVTQSVEMSIELPGGATMEMVYCPPGEFMMGSPEGELDRVLNETLHRVTLTQGFWIGKYPVTQEQWMSVTGTNPSKFKSPDRPVESVSWLECCEFVDRINAAGSAQVSLPTEAQWEYACRAGTNTPFNFGSELNGDLANCDGQKPPYGVSVKGVSLRKTSPVGRYPANAWGVYDMHGNVCEWCADRGGSYNGDAVDPVGPVSGDCRVFRGGSWYNSAQSCRSAYRNWCSPEHRYARLGLRLVCAADRRP